jgi:hypothetical protein
MKRVRVCLDTSVVSCLDAPETPERMIHTQMFWESAKSGVYEIIISDVTLDELDACPEPKRSFMYLKLAEIPHITRVESNDRAQQLARKYVAVGGLSPGRLVAFGYCGSGEM